VVRAGREFTKAWEIKNTGTCAWDEGYVFAFQPSLSSSAMKDMTSLLEVMMPTKQS
jgi:hypothetical protein